MLAGLVLVGAAFRRCHVDWLFDLCLVLTKVAVVVAGCWLLPVVARLPVVLAGTRVIRIRIEHVLRSLMRDVYLATRREWALF